ncbi:hypothetical protein ACJCHP_004558 [Enterobacter asburiae]
MDLVVHCGRHLSGIFLWALSLTDTASEWTECVALPARNAELIIRAVEQVQKSLLFQLPALMLITVPNILMKPYSNTVLPDVSR